MAFSKRAVVLNCSSLFSGVSEAALLYIMCRDSIDAKPSSEEQHSTHSLNDDYDKTYDV